MVDDAQIQGNDRARWKKLLDGIDEKLQFGLLDHLRRARLFHFEENTLFIESAAQEDLEYLARPHVHQQLELFAQDLMGVDKVIVRMSPE